MATWSKVVDVLGAVSGEISSSRLILGFQRSGRYPSLRRRVASWNATIRRYLAPQLWFPGYRKVLAMAGIKHQAGSQDYQQMPEQSPTCLFQDPCGQRSDLDFWMGKWSHFWESGSDRSAGGISLINFWFTQWRSRSITCEALGILFLPIWSKCSKMIATYTPNMIYSDQVDPMKTRSRLAGMVLNDNGIDLPMNRPVLFQKTTQSGNYLTNAFGHV